MLAFSFCPPPHGTPMAGESVPHTKCGTKRVRRAAPETRAERSSLQCPPSAERAALRLAVRERRCAKFPVAREFVLSGYVLRCCRVTVGDLSGACRILIGRPSCDRRIPAGCLSGACRMSIKYNAAEMIRDFPERATQRKRAERTGITTFQLCRTLPPSARRQNKICSLILL